jgi:hypothetical protein
MADAPDLPLLPNQPGLTPLKLIQTYSPEEWEAFIEEWTEGFDPAYVQVVRIGGAGDMGRDVIGHFEPSEVRPRPCDVYQCKHYDHPLTPTDAYLELGKLCVYTQRGDYPLPRRYRFVPPRGIGPKLYNLLNYPDKLRGQLIAHWDQYVTKKVSDSGEFPLIGALKTYVEGFDFTIVSDVTPKEVLTQHQRTRYWHHRFKIDPPVRPQPPSVPAAVQPNELAYVSCLIHAYSNHLNRPVVLSDLDGLPSLLKHFSQARGDFFSAEALNRFSRDNFAAGAFDAIKKHVYDGVIDITCIAHADGFACLIDVLKQAAALLLPASDLTPYVWPADKKGICHHLANEGSLLWVSQS